MMPHDIPWAKVGVDLFLLNNRDYLITVDYYSNFWEVDNLSSTESISVIRKLKAHFARYGIPDVVMSDNGLSSRLNGSLSLLKLGNFNMILAVLDMSV